MIIGTVFGLAKKIVEFCTCRLLNVLVSSLMKNYHKSTVGFVTEHWHSNCNRCNHLMYLEIRICWENKSFECLKLTLDIKYALFNSVPIN